MGKLILVTGGARSGKSSFAEKYVAKYGKNIAYIAYTHGVIALSFKHVKERI